MQNTLQYNLNMLEPMLQGAGVSLALFVITLLLSLPLGWLLSLVRVSRFRPASRLVELYSWVFRGTPLMLQLMFVYFGLPFASILGLHIRLSKEIAAVVVFALNYAAYFAEIFRGGIEAIAIGQYEAADVLGLSRQQVMTRIVLPQAIKVVLPSIGNEVITLVKDTSLAYTLSIVELLAVAKKAATRDMRIDAFLGAMLFYLLFTWLATKAMAFVEKKFSYYQ